MHLRPIVSGPILALSLVTSARAQVTIDATKITCDQFVHAKVGSPRTIAAWLSGSFHGNATVGSLTCKTSRQI
jgi:hypothetical protein